MTPKPPNGGLRVERRRDLNFKNFDKLQELRLETPIWGQGVKKTKIIFNLD